MKREPITVPWKRILWSVPKSKKEVLMKFLYVGVILGVFLGVGLVALYLALNERETALADEGWIDEAIERAFDAVNNSIERV